MNHLRDLYQHQEPYFAATNAAGTYDFSGAITGNGNPGLNNPIYSFADFLIGSVRSASAPAPPLPTNRTSYDFGIFIQDDFKVSQRLTLNLGLRYEVEFLPTSRNDILSRIDPVTGGLLVAGRNATRNLDRDPDYFNLSPRIGLAYSFNDNTVIRSGFGIVHGTTYQDYGPRQQFTGFSFTRSFPGIGTNQAREFTLSQGFPTTAVAGPADPFQRLSVATVNTPLPVQGPTFFPEDPRPYVMQWTGSVQREIGFGTVAEIAYVSSRGVHLSRVYEGNNPTIDVADDLAAAGATNLQQLFRPFPTLSNFLVTSYDATSNYNSLQAKVNRRFAQGLSMQASYTLSKSMDDASNGFGRGEITNNQIPWQFKQLVSVAQSVAKAVESVKQGFTAVKYRMDWSSRAVDVNPAKDWELMNTVRKEIGDKIDLKYDANNGLSVTTAINLAKRFHNELNIIHFEEPIAQHDYAGLAEVTAAVDIPVAAGEHEYTRWQVRDLIHHAKVDILQPDLVKCAGLTEAARIANLAHTYNKILVPHQTQPTVGTMANVHFLACFDHSSVAQEYNYSPENNPKLWDLFKESYAPQNGYVTVPDALGLRLELDEAKMKKHAVA